MRTNAHAPGVAHRAAGAELWLRDMDGRALRTVSLAQAELLVSEGAAYPIVTAAGWREVRFKGILPSPRANSLRTVKGSDTAPGSSVSTYEHNYSACRNWKH